MGEQFIIHLKFSMLVSKIHVFSVVEVTVKWMLNAFEIGCIISLQKNAFKMWMV